MSNLPYSGKNATLTLPDRPILVLIIAKLLLPGLKKNLVDFLILRTRLSYIFLQTLCNYLNKIYFLMGSEISAYLLVPAQFFQCSKFKVVQTFTVSYFLEINSFRELNKFMIQRYLLTMSPVAHKTRTHILSQSESVAPIIY